MPKENPVPPAEVLAGVPKLKVPVGLVLVWVVLLKLKPPPGAAELVVAKPELGAAAVVF